MKGFSLTFSKFSLYPIKEEKTMFKKLRLLSMFISFLFLFSLLSLLELNASQESFVIPDGDRTFYVAPHGNNSHNGSISAPFATLQYAVNQAQPGDVIVVR